MLLASSRQKPIHGGVNVSPKLSVARRKGSGFALIGLSGALEGYRANDPRTRARRRPRLAAWGRADFVDIVRRFLSLAVNQDPVTNLLSRRDQVIVAWQFTARDTARKRSVP